MPVSSLQEDGSKVKDATARNWRNVQLRKGCREYQGQILRTDRVAPYNLARWLVRNEQDAEDVVQESFLKAYKAQESFRGTESKTWVLSIVRNTAIDFLRRLGTTAPVSLDEHPYEPEDSAPNPERILVERSRREQVRRAISQLAPEFREVIVLREIESLSYKEIAHALGIPMGTVMSRLSRARSLLLLELDSAKEVQHDLP
jgi:RNA polymerase sigma-70 factor, ECF subfamily